MKTASLWLALGAATILSACGDSKPAGTTTDSSAPAAAAAGDSAPAAAAATGDPKTVAMKLGEEKYTQICQSCHQSTGLGVENAYPPLAGSEWVTGAPERPIAIVLHGLQGEITVKGKKYNNMMSPWGGVLNDDEAAAVVTYVRNSWGNSADLVTAAQVKAVRDKTAGRSGPWNGEADLKSAGY